MEERTQKALEYLQENEQNMIETWQNIVLIESRSQEKEAVNKIMVHLDTYCDALQMQRKIIGFENAGSSFVAAIRAGAAKADCAFRPCGYRIRPC